MQNNAYALLQQQIYELHSSDVEPLKRLHTLDVSHNNIRELAPTALAKLPRLKHLNLDDNRLQTARQRASE